MAEILSPLQLQAGAALLQNTGLRPAPALTIPIDTYESQSWLSPLLRTISIGGTTQIPNPSPPPDTVGLLSAATIATLQTLGGNVCPALAGSIPSDPVYVVSSPPVTTLFPITLATPQYPGLTGMLTNTAQTYLGSGDVGKFSQTLSIAVGYAATTNTFINSAVNANEYLGPTFTGMDDLITGDLTQVNLDTAGFGADLAKLGNLINLADVAKLGFPLTLIQQVVKQAGLVTPLLLALTLAGVEDRVILQLRDSDLTVSDTVQKRMYQAMTLIQGDDLDQILQVLGVQKQKVVSQPDLSIPDPVMVYNIQTMADLLNPVKIFPNSFSTLTTPICECEDPPVLPIQVGDFVFQTRDPPAGAAAVYDQECSAWSTFLNNNAVWNFTGTVFDSRNPPGGGVTPQTCVGWSEWMNQHAVWESDIFASTFTRSFTITVPATGNYLFTTQVDDYATISIDGNVILDAEGFIGPPPVYSIYLEAGSRTLGISATNPIGPGGFSLIIEPAPVASDTFSRSYTVDFPVTGFYTWTGQADNSCSFAIDGDVVFDQIGFAGPPTSRTVLVQAGEHVVQLSGVNNEGPAGIGLTITFGGTLRGSNLRGIYLPNPQGLPTGAVNSQLETQLPEVVLALYTRLRNIIPQDQALAMLATGSSLQQITNVIKMTLPQLAAAFAGVETNKDLNEITEQLQVMPPDVLDFYLQNYATGTGPDGTILLTDILGTMIGTVSGAALSNVTATLQTLDSAGALAYLGTIYTNMENCVNGSYADPMTPGGVIIPMGQPAAGTYTDADSAVQALIPLAKTEIANIVSAYPSQTTSMNNQFNSIANQLVLEKTQQDYADLDFANLSANSQTSSQSLVFALPAYGKDTTEGGTAEILEGVADVETAGGQAIVACLREGRNRDVLDASGVGTANQVSDRPATPPPPAPLIPSRYDAGEARSRITT